MGRSRYSGADRRGRVCPFFVPEIWVYTTSKQVGDVSLSVQKLNELFIGNNAIIKELSKDKEPEKKKVEKKSK